MAELPARKSAVSVIQPGFTILTHTQPIDTSVWGPPSPDPSGIAYDSVRDKLLIVDGEVDEVGLWSNVNFFESTRTGTLERGADLTSFSIEPVGIAYDPIRHRVFISDDDKRKVFIVDAGPDTLVGTADDNVSDFSTLSFGSDDPEGISYDFVLNRLFIADGIGARIYEIRPGPNGVLDGVDDQITHFDAGDLGISDPETIEYSPTSGTLFIVTRGPRRIVEATTAGAFVMEIDLTSVPMTKPAGLALAPSSTDPDSAMSLYIVDRGIDNNSDPDENDGRIYEIQIGPPPTPGPGIGGVVLARGSEWKYHDLGLDLGTAWRDSDYVDTAWPSGPGVLGYGESYVTTTVSYGPSSSNKYATTYFRTAFDVTAAEDVTGMTLHVMYDDGVIIYLNGAEVARLDLSSGPVSYSTYDGSHEGGSYVDVDLGAFTGLLVDGRNVLAAEVHQGSSSSSDMVFDAELETEGSGLPAPDITPPSVALLVAPSNGLTVFSAPELDWQDVEDPSGVSYQLEIDDDSTFASPVAIVDGLTTSSHVSPALAFGDYWWRVETVDGVGLSSGWSGAWAFTLSDIDTIPPTIPSLVTPADSAIVTALPTFDWSDVVDASGVDYWLQVDDDVSFTSPVLDAPELVLSQHVDVLPAGSYVWRVQAVDGFGLHSGWSSARRLIADYTDTTPPAAPTLLDPASDDTLSGAPLFTWAEVVDESGVHYALQVDDDSSFASPLLSVVGHEDTTFAVGTIDEGTFAWRVQATDSIGLVGAWSATRQVTVDYPDTIPPAAPTLIYPMASSTLADSPWFDWTIVPDESGVSYHLQVDDDPGFGSPAVDSSGIATAGFVPAPLAEAVYTWRVRATDGAGLVGDWSTAWQVTVDYPDTLAPATPTLLAPASAATINGTPSFNWDDVTDESSVSYHLQVDDDPSFGTPALDIAALGASQYDWVLPSGDYHWRVKAVDAGGLESAWSEARLLTVVLHVSSGGLLIERATLWNANDLGLDLGTAWRETSYVDTSWTSGPGPLGYGESYLNTIVSYGSDPGNVHTTTYFRRTFGVAGAADVTALTLRVMYDDGFVAYLNGTEIERLRLSSGAISYDTQASSHEASNNYQTIDVSSFASLLVDGDNLLAVEVHQSGSSSSDLVFDAELESAGGGVPVADTTPPPIPLPLSPHDEAMLVGLPSFDWLDVSDASGVSYQLQIDDDPGFASPALDSLGIASSAFTPAELPTGEYAWRVQAIDGVGLTSGWSPARALTVTYPDTLAPAAPALLAPADQVVVGSVPVIDWEDVTDPSGVTYRLQLDDDSAFETPVLDLAGLDVSVYAPSSFAAGTYVWRVMATDGADNASAWSEVWSFTVGSKPSNEPGRGRRNGRTAAELLLTPTFVVGPVPSRGAAVTITFSAIGIETLTPITIEVFDLSGRKVRSLVRERFQRGLHTVVWDGRGSNGLAAPTGVYFVMTRRGGAIETRRIVITR